MQLAPKGQISDSFQLFSISIPSLAVLRLALFLSENSSGKPIGEFIVTQVSEAEEALTVEAVRRQLVLDKRKVARSRDQTAAALRARLKAAGRLVEVEVSGTFEASARCLFLFDRARSTGGVCLSSDLGTAACTSSGNRGMVLGSRGFRGGVHYWEVGFFHRSLPSIGTAIERRCGIAVVDRG